MSSVSEFTVCVDINGDTHLVNTGSLIVRSSVYAVAIIEDRLLVIRDRGVSRWDLPGGGIELLESNLEALHREVQEETGLLLDGPVEFLTRVVEHFYDIDSQQGWKSYRSFYRVGVVGDVSGRGNGDDISEVSLLSTGEIAKVVAPTTREVLRAIGCI